MYICINVYTAFSPKNSEPLNCDKNKKKDKKSHNACPMTINASFVTWWFRGGSKGAKRQGERKEREREGEGREKESTLFVYLQ